MLTTLATRYHQHKPHAAVMKVKWKKRGQRKYMRGELTLHQRVLETVQHKSSKQFFNENFRKSVNDRTHADNATEMAQYPKLSAQVR